MTWKDFSGIRDLENPILTLPLYWIGPLLFKNCLGQLWKYLPDNTLINKAGSWEFREVKWILPEEGQEHNLIGKIIF